ncbi:MAG: hypothetical protein HOV86_12080 [Thermoactinospora sp.]|nr:hypothetical protein [Thermoactinospora sp.]
MFPRVLFDETHGQAWTIRRELAEQLNPGHPDDSSYARAAGHLRRLGHHVTAGGLDLDGQDVLVIAHPSGPRFEKVLPGSPVYSAGELDAIEEFVRLGGGLVVLAEEEQDKYGNNLRELLERFGVGVEHTTVRDVARSHREVATWVLGTPGSGGLLAGASRACFYRAGTLVAPPSAQVLFASSPSASPAGAPLAVALPYGQGRVVVFADSDLFGDDSIDDYDHLALWGNVVTWAARTPAGTSGRSQDPAKSALFGELKAAIEELRPLQAKDGSVEPALHGQARELVGRISATVEKLAPHFPHDAAYLAQVRADLAAWDLGVPDFLRSLDLFHPDTQRVDGLEHLVLFPMYTQNGNPGRNFEAVWLRTIWPDWIAELESSGYDNPMFVPIAFEDFTAGYDTFSAVLFPETVSVAAKPEKFSWGGIFADREAARFRVVSEAAAKTLKLDLPPDAERLLASQQLAQDVFVMWDLIHDRTHSHGDLPFDPFMIKQRQPYWMYALEELRCDLTAYGEAVKLEAEGVAHARFVQLAILFDRLFRFPITGERVRNYDGLGGQLLFAYLHRNDIVRWTDNSLTIDWARVADGVADLRGEVEKLYRDGIDRAKVAHWLAAYELVAEYVEPHPMSAWKRRELPAENKAMVDAVLSDEFPLSMFYEALRRKLAAVVESTRGIRA